MAEYKLKKPIITGAGETIEVLNLDWDSLSFGDFQTVRRVRLMMGDVSASDSVSPKLDNGLRIALAWVAAVKGTKGLVVEDCVRLSMLDTLELSDECFDDYLTA